MDKCGVSIKLGLVAWHMRTNLKQYFLVHRNIIPEDVSGSIIYLFSESNTYR